MVDWVQAVPILNLKIAHILQNCVELSLGGLLIISARFSRVGDLVLGEMAAISKAVQGDAAVGSDCESRDAAMGKSHANPCLGWQL